MLKDKPGRTTIVEHTINTDMANPVRLPPYRVPHAMVESELKEMLDNGIIEASASFNGPSKEKDGSLRMCRLISVFQVDAYPVCVPSPRVDELLDRLSKANYGLNTRLLAGSCS